MLENEDPIFLQQQVLSGKLPRAIRQLYLSLIILIFAMLATTWWVKLDVAVKSGGIIRPAKERTAVKTAISGLLDSILVTEGQMVKKGDYIAILKDEGNHEIAASILAEKNLNLALLADLDLLLKLKIPIAGESLNLKTAVYQEQLSQFIQLLEEKNILYEQASREYEVARKLVSEKVIAPAEFSMQETTYLQKASNLKAFWHERFAAWNRDRQQIVEELQLIEQKNIELNTAKKRMLLIAPVSGIVSGIREQYSQAFVQSGDVLCAISPEDSLVAECLVGSADIGFLKKGQPVSFRVDAFDHKQFGTVSGAILYLDQDFTNINDHPVFKVRCSIKQQSLALKNGYKAYLKKGMTIQARFIITKRTIWQLFFDNLHNWLEPIVTV
ncbi:HlyD family secretion protein [Flavihumibacter profundi]|uniref:HlyD family secretion protein n=1 Tax=Flavihumibacter profundi TaxID=2716883 RepID=UPI001CC7CC60|nr:HlyD family efflux transporter periplasmic adaptor subunit [Flavihumibacter profundi]MBZ5859235.1 HlyD family secretion protein [Flavihumibacter profundi]